MNRDLMFSSEKDDWETPQDLFDKYDSIFHFDLDVCASDRNKKCSVFFSKEDDCRKHEWFGKVWMNPPYGRNIGTFVKKAYEEIFRGGVRDSCHVAPSKDGHKMVSRLLH